MGLTLTDAKREILFLLDADPRHGYALARELNVQGPTAYEHLQELEEARYIKGEQSGRRKIYLLTEKGELTVQAERAGE